MPKPDHVAPFQPSPHESVAVSVQNVLAVTVSEPVKGLPPESVVPSLHMSDQPTSPGYEPPDTVIGDVHEPPSGGVTTGGDGDGDGGGDMNSPAMKVKSKGPEPLGIV